MEYRPTGDEILPDESGNFWCDEACYRLGDGGAKKQSFRQPRPRLKPHLVLKFEGGGYKLVEGAADDPDAIQRLFQDLSVCMRETLGGYEGYLACASFLSCFAAREIFEIYGAFPGLWFTGEKGQGKTTQIQLLMELQGFDGMKSGLGLLRNSSAVGMQIAMEQYSNLFVWLDEFRDSEIERDKRSIIHSAFNRELCTKFAEDGVMRKLRASFVVGGESSTSDAAN